MFSPASWWWVLLVVVWVPRGALERAAVLQGGGFSRVTAGAVLQGVCAGCGFRGCRV